MQLASCTIHPKPADDASSEPVYEFTAEQVKAIEELRRKLNFTPDEVDQRLRRTQAGLRRIAAASTLQEQQRIGAQVWVEWVERPRAARRVQAARRVAPMPPVQRMPGHSLAAPRERREASSSRTSGQDPGDDDPEPPSRRLDGRPDIEAWVAERKQTLDALTRGEQLRLDGGEGS